MSQQTVLLNHHDHLLSSPSSSSSSTSSPSLKKRLGSAFSRIRKQSKSNASKSSTEKSNNKPAPSSLHHPSQIKRHSSDVGPHHGTNNHHQHHHSTVMNDDDANSNNNNNTSSYYSAHNNNDTDTLSSNAQSDVDVKSAPAKLKKTMLDDLDSPLKHYNHTNTRNKRSSLQFSSSPSKSSFLSNNNNNSSSSGISAIQDFNDDHASLSKTKRRSTSLHNIFALTQHDSAKAVVEQLSHQSYQPIKNDSYHNNNNSNNSNNITSPSITIGKSRRSIFSASNNRKRKSNSHHVESAIELDRIPLDSVHYQPENMPSLSTSPSNKQSSSNSRAVRLIQALTPRRMGGLLTPRSQQHQLTSGGGNSTHGGYHHHQSASMQDHPTKTTTTSNSNSSSSVHSASSQVLISNHHNDGTRSSVMVGGAEQHSHVLATTTNTVGGSLNSASNIDFSSRNQRDDFYEKLSSNSGVAEHGQHASNGHYHERLTSFDTNSENTSSIILQDFDDSERFSLDVHSTAVFKKKLAAALSSTPSTPVTTNNDASVVVDSDVNANRENDDENSVVVDRVTVDQDTTSEGIMDDSNVNEMKSSFVGSTRSRSTPKRKNKRNLAYFSPSSSPRSKETSPSQSSSYQKEMPPETRRSVAALLAHAVASRKTSSNNESLHDPDQSINATTEKGDGTSQILTDDEFTAEDDESTDKIMGDQSPRKKENFVIPSLSLGTMSSNITSNIVVDDNSSSSSSNSLHTARTNTGSSEEVTVEQLIHQYASMNKAERLKDLLIRERERLRQLEDDDLNLSAMLSELVNCADSRDNSTPLHKAAAKNNCEVLEILLKEFKETKIDAKDNLESTALHWACANNALEAIFILCKFGASINVRDRYGFAPIHLTIKKKCFRGADVLLLYNGDINFKMSNGSTALHWACENNEMEIVKWLMRKDKVNPHARDKLKETPILRAATKGNMEVIEYFLQNNLVQWNLRDDKMQSLLHKAAYYGNNDLIMRVANANPIATGAMMNERDRDGNTPLHLAVRKDQFRAMKSLLLMGAEMNIQNKHGNTPLHIAVELKDYKTARYLHQSSANADLKNKKGQTPRDIAVLHAKELPPNTILRVHEDPMKIFV